jgi:predicted amidophosphoribosyltransferase
MSLVQDIAPPFVERESSVRVVSDEEVVKESSGAFCSSCEKPITPELDFCTNCGEFL